jgi:hypothetical protein
VVRAGGGALLAALLAASCAFAAAPGVKVALLPELQTVAPGSEFELSLEVVREGAAFNAFDAYIGYDPTALTFLPQSPISQQEGAYFVAACPNRFHRFRAGSDRDTITDVLLCASTSIPGPGQIYKLRFKASDIPQATRVYFLPGLQFYNDGLFVNPDSSSDARIGIGLVLATPPAAPRAPALRLVVAPNPAREHVSLRIETDRSGWQRLRVTDLQGRLVRRLDDGSFGAGMRTVSWDGRDDTGAAVPPGRYIVTLSVPGRTLQTQFTVLR